MKRYAILTLGCAVRNKRLSSIAFAISREGTVLYIFILQFFMENFTQNNVQSQAIRRYIIHGSRTPSNYWWATVTVFGGAGFIVTGLSSFFHRNLLFFLDSSTIIFFPQGLVMTFYGVIGLLFGFYLCFTLYWRIGSGFNEFNKQSHQIRIFRWGFPGKNRRIDLVYSLADVQSVRVDIQDGLTPKRALYLIVKDKGEIPLMRVSVPCPVEEIEVQAAELAKFLQVGLEMKIS